MVMLEAVSYLLVAAGGAAVVLTRDPRRQALMQSLFGMSLTLLFLVLQAPDVALSEVTVGAAALPLMILVALANVRQDAGAGRRCRRGCEGADTAMSPKMRLLRLLVRRRRARGRRATRHERPGTVRRIVVAARTDRRGLVEPRGTAGTSPHERRLCGELRLSGPGHAGRGIHPVRRGRGGGAAAPGASGRVGARQARGRPRARLATP